MTLSRPVPRPAAFPRASAYAARGQAELSRAVRDGVAEAVRLNAD